MAEFEGSKLDKIDQLIQVVVSLETTQKHQVTQISTLASTVQKLGTTIDELGKIVAGIKATITIAGTVTGSILVIVIPIATTILFHQGSRLSDIQLANAELKGQLGESVERIESMVRTVIAPVRQAATDSENASKAINAAVGELTGVAKSLQEATSALDDAAKAVKEATPAVESLKEAAADLKAASQRIENATNSLNTNEATTTIKSAEQRLNAALERLAPVGAQISVFMTIQDENLKESNEKNAPVVTRELPLPSIAEGSKLLSITGRVVSDSPLIPGVPLFLIVTPISGSRISLSWLFRVNFGIKSGNSSQLAATSTLSLSSRSANSQDQT